MGVPLMSYWSISSQFFTKKASELGLDVEIISKEKNLFYIKNKTKEVLFKSTDFGCNSSLGLKISNDKELTYKILDRHAIPIAKTWYISKNEMANIRNLNIKFPVIIKPLKEGHGDGVMMNIYSLNELSKKLNLSFANYNKMIIQRQINGDEHRVVVYKGEVIMAVTRTPAHVIGNGISTISELINVENSTNTLRGEGYNSALSYIIINDELIECIGKQGLSLDSIALKGVTVYVRSTSNIGSGGTACDILHLLSENIKESAIFSAEVLGLDFAGVDIITTDLTKNMEDGDGIVLEINSTSGLGSFEPFLEKSPTEYILKDLFKKK